VSPEVCESFRDAIYACPKQVTSPEGGTSMSDGDDRRKHLEFIQQIVTRLASNSFAYKGWTVVLVTGLFALGSKDATPAYLLVGALPAIAFWGLDAYYLRQERLFRELYDAVRLRGETNSQSGEFAMSTTPVSDRVDGWLRTLGSRSLWPFYGTMVAVTIIAAIVAASRVSGGPQ